jgi:hypothetical protein
MTTQDIQTVESAMPARSESLLGFRWSALVILLVGLVSAASSFFWPFGRDQGFNAHAGMVILQGGVPFKDVWDIKGPGMQYIFALSEIVFGRNLWGIRLLDMLCQIAVAFILYRMVERLAGPLCALLAACLFLVSYYQGGFWCTAQCESFAMLLMVAGLFLVDREPPGTSILASFAGGLCYGALPWLKPHFVILAAAPVVLFLVLRLLGQAGTKWLIRTEAAFLAGTGLGIGLLALWAIATGAWRPMMEIYLYFNRTAYFQVGPESFLDHVRTIRHYVATTFTFITPLALVGLVALLVRRRRGSLGFLLLGLMGFVVLVMANKYFLYQWLVMLPSAAAFAGCSAIVVVAAAKERASVGTARRWMRYALFGPIVVLTVLAFVVPLRNEERDLSQVAKCIQGRRTWNHYYDRFTSSHFRFPDALAAARQLRETTRPEDPVLVWAFDPVIYYLAGRHSPTRYGHPYPLAMVKGNPCLAQWRREFMQDLERRPPAMIVVGVRDSVNVTGRTSEAVLREFPAFRRFLTESYVLDRTLESYQIWRSRSQRARPKEGAIP